MILERALIKRKSQNITKFKKNKKKFNELVQSTLRNGLGWRPGPSEWEG